MYHVVSQKTHIYKTLWFLELMKHFGFIKYFQPRVFNSCIFARMEKPHNPWQTLDNKRVYDNAWITVHEDQVINPRGGQNLYGWVQFKNKAIGIVPVDEVGNTWLVGQHRYTLNEYSWEIPMGGGPNEQDPLESAKRELKEETGLTAQQWKKVMRIHTSNSVTDEEGFIYLAQELTLGNTEFDDTEDLQVKKLPLAEALDMVLAGQVTDAISISGIFSVARTLGL